MTEPLKLKKINKATLLKYSYNVNNSWADVVQACTEWQDYINGINSIGDQKSYLEKNLKYLEKYDIDDIEYREHRIESAIVLFNKKLIESKFIKNFVVKS